MKLLCPAKINLTLEVLAEAPNGYRSLRSVMVPIGIYDEIAIAQSREFSFTCDDAALGGADNLAARAVRALDPGARVSIALKKRIPTKAGLGGGSSDAAASLRAAMRGALQCAAEPDWLATARSLGSDVPFFLAGTAALVEGTGERVTAIGTLPDWHVLVVKPPVGVATADAYAMLDTRTPRSRPRNISQSLLMVEAFQRRDFAEVQSLLGNDFHEPVASATPEVALSIAALVQAGARHALLCGSGSAVFTMAETATEISAIQERLELPAEYLCFKAPFASTPDWRGHAS